MAEDRVAIYKGRTLNPSTRAITSWFKTGGRYYHLDGCVHGRVLGDEATITIDGKKVVRVLGWTEER
jgi:hypothetical protein